MSRQTSKELRKLFFYQVYIRNHTKSGTFKEFIYDLDRIKELGTDVVYLLPVHEIGKKQKKGDLGCPYSIKDYRSINSEYGTLDDFKQLINEVHKRNMKLMIDVVYNHTSYDSVLLEKHPEYFYKENGEFKNRVGDWWDITDLDYTVSKELWVELINTLLYWVNLGIDGFRWDVASLLPLEFLEEAHDRVLDVNPDIIFLSESVHESFLLDFRQRGFDGLSESEIYQVFDIAYDYDIHPFFEEYLHGNIPFDRYLQEIKRQEVLYPGNYVKLRNLENHDNGRFAPMVDNNLDKINNWTAFIFFQKGATMIYAGQEKCDNNLPSLFDIDKVNWDGADISSLIKKVSRIVKDDIFAYGIYDIQETNKDLFVGSYAYQNKEIFGIFNVGLIDGDYVMDLPDGTYLNLIDNEEFHIKQGKVQLLAKPLIFYK